MNASFLVRPGLSALSDGLCTDHIMHVVIVQMGRIAETAGFASLVFPFGKRVRGVLEHQILFSFFGSGITDDHHLIGERGEILPFVLHAVLCEAYMDKSRIQRKRAGISFDIFFLNAGFDVEGACRCETTETERIFGICLIRHLAIEVVLSELRCLCLVLIQKSLTDLLQHVCRVLVYVPVIISALGSVRATAPEALFIESDVLGSYGTEDVRSDASVADGQSLLFPFRIQIAVSAAGGCSGIVSPGRLFAGSDGNIKKDVHGYLLGIS